MANDILRALFMAAPQFQGGHSDVGMEIADALGIPFPVSMPNLRPAAIKAGFLPYDLWPWLKRMDEQLREALVASSPEHSNHHPEKEVKQ